MCFDPFNALDKVFIVADPFPEVPVSPMVLDGSPHKDFVSCVDCVAAIRCDVEWFVGFHNGSGDCRHLGPLCRLFIPSEFEALVSWVPFFQKTPYPALGLPGVFTHPPAVYTFSLSPSSYILQAWSGVPCSPLQKPKIQTGWFLAIPFGYVARVPETCDRFLCFSVLDQVISLQILPMSSFFAIP